MGTFSKKYTHTLNSDEFIFVTWETGFQNIKVYKSNKIVASVLTKSELKEGVVIEDNDLGTIKIYFNQKPSEIGIEINGHAYKTENKIDIKSDFGGVASMFWVLFIGSVIWLLFVFIVGGAFLFQFLNTAVFVVLFVHVFTTILYLVSAIFLNKGRIWAYFMGTFTFLIMTSFYLFEMVNGFSEVEIIPIFSMFIRLSILIFFGSLFRKALIALKNSGENSHEDLLDNL